MKTVSKSKNLNPFSSSSISVVIVCILARQISLTDLREKPGYIHFANDNFKRSKNEIMS